MGDRDLLLGCAGRERSRGRATRTLTENDASLPQAGRAVKAIDCCGDWWLRGRTGQRPLAALGTGREMGEDLLKDLPLLDEEGTWPFVRCPGGSLPAEG